MTDQRITPSSEIIAARAQLQDRLAYQFANMDLFAEALTHPSVIKHDEDIKHNQRLEFLGDRVISLVIADTLFSSTDLEREGILTRRHADCVENARLCQIARDLDIGSTLLVQGNTSLNDNDKVLADALEALIGAIWRDGGMDAARRVILHVWGPLIADTIGYVKDFKTRLHEYAHKHKISPPLYEVAGRVGPDHAPEFTIHVTCGADVAFAKGTSKQLAEQAAAEVWLAQHSDRA